MSAPEKTGVIGTASPTDELPIEWPNIGLRMRSLIFGEAVSLARQFMEDGSALITYPTVTTDGDLVIRCLLPQSGGETAVILSPISQALAGGWVEINSILERI